MSNATVFGLAQVQAASTLTIYNVTSPGTANDEFSQALSAGTKSFTIKVRGNDPVELQFSFVTGLPTFKTVEAFCEFSSPAVNLTGKTLFMKVDAISAVVEIEEWK